MKKITILLCAAFVMMLFTQCTKATADQLVSKEDTRGMLISELMNNEAYVNQVLDSLHAKHSGIMMGRSHEMMKGNRQMGMNMMDHMMEMSMSDTAMFKRMMNKTMAMCDLDSTRCNMMASSMQAHPKVMKSMKMGRTK